MSIGLKALAAGAAAVLLAGLAGSAQAQPGYGYSEDYGQLPPPPYQEFGGGGQATCGRDHFTLLGAHAGVTVLGLDAGVSAHLGVPLDEDCGQGYAQPTYEPRPYAPPEQPAGYGPPPYAYALPGYGQPAYPQMAYPQPMYAEPAYALQPQPQPMWGYGAPCGCGAPGW